jgi:hypothetical protein
MVCYGEENTVHFPGKVVLGADKAAIATQSYVDEKIAAIEIPSGDSEEVIYSGNYACEGDLIYFVVTGTEKAKFDTLKAGDTVRWRCIVDGDTEKSGEGEITERDGDLCLPGVSEQYGSDCAIYYDYDSNSNACVCMIVSQTNHGFLEIIRTSKAAADVDLSNYYTKEEVDALIPDVSGYQTASDVQSAISTALSAIGIAEEGSF